jgi:hypothetical protein
MDLKIIFPDGSEYEPLELTPLGDNRYRAEESIIPLAEPEQFIRYQGVVEGQVGGHVLMVTHVSVSVKS